MYITETTESVKKLIEELEQMEDLNKLKFLIYIFGLLNNNQINDKNEANPDLVENNEMEIFTLETIGLSQNACTLLLQYFAMLYNKLTFTENAYEDNGNIMGIDYDKDDKKLDSQFEKLEYNEKLDVFSEVIIRYHLLCLLGTVDDLRQFRRDLCLTRTVAHKLELFHHQDQIGRAHV